MELTHSFTVPAPVDEAWALLMDLERVGSCFPGATVTDVNDDAFSGTVKVKLGPIAMLYSGSGRFVERDDDAHRAVLEAKGKDKRGNGTAGATVTLQLSDDGGVTRADVATDLAVTGKPAQFGRGVLQDVSDKLLGQFVDCIQTQLGGSQQADASDAASPAAASAPQDVQEVSEVAAAPPGPDASLPGAVDEAGAPATPDTVHRAADTATKPEPAGRRFPAGDDDAIDLGADMLPILLKHYAAPMAAGLVGLAVGILLGRQRRSGGSGAT